MKWNTSRRGLLKAAGATFATLATAPRFAWAADGDTLRIRPSLVEWLFGIAFLFAMLVGWMTGNVLSTMYGAMST